MRILIAVLAVLLLTGAGDDVACVTESINTLRAVEQMQTVTVNETLSAYAQGHSRQMAESGALTHSVSPTLPVDWQAWGENIGVGPSCAVIVAAFAKSPRHRAIILTASYTQVGVGVAYDDDYGIYITELFLQTRAPRSHPRARETPGPVRWTIE